MTDEKKAPPASNARPTKAPTGPGEVYGSMVGDILANEPRTSSFVPEVALRLRIASARQPRSVAELCEEERLQLRGVFGAELETALASDELMIEAAEVIDEDTGDVRYRLYGWNYGAGFLFQASGTGLVGFAAQHDIEHWNLAQRDVFWAMDGALRKPGHHFEQPLSFCWWREECWDEIANRDPGTVGSEPYLRAEIAKHLAEGA